MNSDALEMRQYICNIHAYLTTLLIYGQICIILIGRNMNPESFSVYTSAGLVTMDQSMHDRRHPDSLISIFSESAQRVTMFLMVPVASGMLNTLDSISCVRLMLTAPTVLKVTTIA